jgi:hypothetical protein
MFYGKMVGIYNDYAFIVVNEITLVRQLLFKKKNCLGDEHKEVFIHFQPEHYSSFSC